MVNFHISRNFKIHEKTRKLQQKGRSSTVHSFQVITFKKGMSSKRDSLFPHFMW